MSDVSSEKQELEQQFSPSSSSEPYVRDPKVEKRILRKIDLRLLPILGALYTICLVDRSNISVARISGLDEDVGLDVGSRASIVLLVFFIGYIIFEIPSNIVIKKVGAATWIALITFAWGAVSIGFGFANSWEVIAVLRVILGSLEAGFFPGCVYLVGSWYVRYEVQKRLAGFYLMAQGLAGFANILAYGIIQIAKHTSYKGWRWIYIVEGAITCVAGLLSWFIIIDFPDSSRNKFLTDQEKAIVLARLQNDQGKHTPEKVNWKVIGRTMKDWQVWSYAFMYMTGAIGSYAFTFFLPIILEQGLGFSEELAFILVAPPVLFAVIEVLVISWLADRYQTRAPFLVLQGIVAIVGLAMTGFLSTPYPRYVGTFLGQAGVYGFIVTTLAWQANNVRGDAKKSVASAILIMASGIGGIYSSLVFREQDAPNYVPGIIAVMACCVVTVILAVITAFLLRRQNRRADRGEIVIEGQKGFRYTI